MSPPGKRVGRCELAAAFLVVPTTAGVRYDVAMDVLMSDTESRRGCLQQVGVADGDDCRSVSRALITFPDDVVERRSVDAHWVAIFPVGGASRPDFGVSQFRSSEREARQMLR